MRALTFLALRELADGRFHSGEDVARTLNRSRASLSEALSFAPELGLEIFSVRGKGYKLAQPIEFIDAAQVMRETGDARIRLEVMDEIDSTSTRLLERAAAGAPSGTCLAAEWQSAGRGRRGRAWVSSLGGSLTFSLLWRFERGAGHLGGLSLAVGLAVARALAACGVQRVQVKWPNDVVVDLRKIAGILVETSGEMQGPSVAVIGVGVNCKLAESVIDRIDQPVTDVASCAAALPSRSALLAALLRELAMVLGTFERTGFTTFREPWLALHAYQGRRVQVSPGREAAFAADVIDVGADGALHVRADDGRTLPLSSAEISLRRRRLGSECCPLLGSECCPSLGSECCPLLGSECSVAEPLLLVVDAGNTRIKWAAHDGRQYVAKGAVGTANPASLHDDWAGVPAAGRALASNVAGDEVATRIREACTRFGIGVAFIAARAEQLGVRNRYAEPSQLGTDRWAALIAANGALPGNKLVVNAGTALTVDALTADGEFLGGLIVPGPALMRRSLAGGTAGLRLTEGALRDFPRSTPDAIMSGAIHAAVGAIERMAAMMARHGHPADAAIVSGGAAEEIAPHLSIAATIHENLVLDGLVLIARNP